MSLGRREPCVSVSHRSMKRGGAPLVRVSLLASGNDLVMECSVPSLGTEPLSNLVGIGTGTGSPWEVLGFWREWGGGGEEGRVLRTRFLFPLA